MRSFTVLPSQAHSIEAFAELFLVQGNYMEIEPKHKGHPQCGKSNARLTSPEMT
jgi:hypothetical protein